MTQTLTTEQLKERIGHLKERLRDMKQHKYPDDCPNATAYLESLKAERQQDIELLEELLANREAQPAGFYTTVSGRKGVVWHNGAPEDDTAIFTAPPAPAVPDEMKGITPYCHGWNECRAAMLDGTFIGEGTKSQPASQGYKLNSPDIPDGCQWTYDEHDYKWDSGCGEAWMFSDGGPVENGVKFCQHCGKPVLLAAAPEGGK